VRSTSICFKIAGSCGKLLRSTGNKEIIGDNVAFAKIKMRRKTSLYAASVHFRWYRFRRLAMLRSMPLNNAPNSCTVIW
jgi:hypothetical protein